MNKIKQLILDEKIILFIIIINSLTIFFEGFDEFGHKIQYTITLIDSLITVVFILEAIVKIKHYGWERYIKENWNKMDIILVILSLPSLVLLFFHNIHADLSFLLVLRISRVFRFLRFFKFIPGIKHLLKGILRALKSSLFVFILFFIYNFIISIISCYFFKEASPDLFGNPLKSFYSTFKIFTVEGWYEIPDLLSKNMDTISAILVKTYFILILITGGIFGLSLVNSIFVDSMVSDNNDELEAKVDELNEKIDKLIEKINKKE